MHLTTCNWKLTNVLKLPSVQFYGYLSGKPGRSDGQGAGRSITVCRGCGSGRGRHCSHY